MASSKQLDKARAAFKKKNFEFAIELYLLHLKVNPKDVEARQELRSSERANKKVSGGGGWGSKLRAKKVEAQARMIRLNKKDPEKTMLACEELLKQDPDIAYALIRLGEAASYANHNEVAVYIFEDAIAVDKTNQEAWRLLGRVHEGTDELEKALKCFERLSKLNPKDREALDKIKKIPASITSRGFQEGSKKGFQGLIDKEDAEKLKRQSARVRTPEQALERINELEPLVEKDPKDIKTMRKIAELYVKADQDDEAIAWCEQALEVDPHFYLAMELRGDLLLKELEAKVTKLEKAYRRAPDDAQLKRRLAKARQARVNLEIEEYSARIEAHPTEPGLRFHLGRTFFDSNQIDAAIPHLQKAKGDPRKKANAGFYLGQCYIKKKILKLALKEFDSARTDLFEMEGLKKDITYMIARIWEGAGKKEKAISEYEQIAEVDFNFKDVTQRLEALSGI